MTPQQIQQKIIQEGTTKIDTPQGPIYYTYLHTKPTTAAKLDPQKGTIQITKFTQHQLKTSSNKKITYTQEETKQPLSSFAITNITQYKTPIPGTEVIYDITIKHINGETYQFTKEPLSTIYDTLTQYGIATPRYHGLDPIEISLKIYRDLNLIKYKEEPAQPGFFYINNKLIHTTPDHLPQPDTTKLKESLTILNQLITSYDTLQYEAGYIIKWFLTAPTSFARKQHGQSIMPWMYVYGKSRAGKTVLGRAGTLIWGQNPLISEKGASSFTTEAKFGVSLSHSTYPVIVNEGERLIQNRTQNNISDLIKEAVYSLTARERGTIRGGAIKIPALAPLYITSNVASINAAELGARFEGVEFHLPKPRTPEEMKEFDRTFKPTGEDTPLKKLIHIGAWMKQYLLNNPETITQPWEQVSTQALTQMYNQVGLPIPEWITGEVQKIDYHTAAIEEEEDILAIFKTITLEGIESPGTWDPDTKTYQATGLHGKLQEILTKQPHPWLEYRQNQKGPMTGEWIYLNRGISIKMQQYTGRYISLQTLADIIGGKLIKASTTKPNGKTTRVTVIALTPQEFYAIFDLTPTGEYIEQEI